MRLEPQRVRLETDAVDAIAKLADHKAIEGQVAGILVRIQYLCTYGRFQVLGVVYTGESPGILRLINATVNSDSRHPTGLLI